ncbi:MAG: 2-iminoacetate synthase ThiH [Verrucomicrobiae bacterium]|nr:2-iminoacetate synthase ThiH [Verrucomicrobiae bacterium]
MAFSHQLTHDLEHPSRALIAFQKFLEPCDDTALEQMAQQSVATTRRYFGKTMRLFAPLYLSNECINSCAYCGFSRDNPILRVTLDVEQMAHEAAYLAKEGFRNILLVAGEHPKFVSSGYLERCIERLREMFPAIALEVAPMEEEEYRPLVAAGAEGLIIYQETYDRDIYKKLHTAGPKKDFDWRLDALERGYRAGFRRLGAGALFGLTDWRTEATALAAHLLYLQRHCWKAQLSVSLPRLRPAAGGFKPRYEFLDRDFAQLVFALRLTFPQIHLVMSTRESAELRDALVPLGFTMMSAGSHTEPGGYTGQGSEQLHQTVKGKMIASSCDGEKATEQFEIADNRSPAVVAAVLQHLGLEPVWKDWDTAILEKKFTGMEAMEGIKK